jgi:hypothetical protein
MHETQAVRDVAQKVGIPIPANGANVRVAGEDAVLMTALDALILAMKQRRKSAAE